MTTRIIQILLLFVAFSFTKSVCAQETLSVKWDGEKIKGVRFLPYAAYQGFPFLSNNWMSGKVEFADGESADGLNLRYSTFKDELIYYNKNISAQIVIDKASLSSFSLHGADGKTQIFRKQFYDGYMKGDRYFEVLSAGEPDLLVYRKVSLQTTSAYKDQRGVLTNLEYANDYQFYFYSHEKGYTSVKPNWLSLIAKFAKTDQKPIKRLLRKNKIRISNEESFVRAWKVIEKEGYKIIP
jgi:hypothetical protein